jgi:hypothetical protein
VLILPGDVSVEADVQALIEDTVAGLGSVDVVSAYHIFVDSLKLERM